MFFPRRHNRVRTESDSSDQDEKSPANPRKKRMIKTKTFVTELPSA